jgi:hypothetical protein
MKTSSVAIRFLAASVLLQFCMVRAGAQVSYVSSDERGDAGI